MNKMLWIAWREFSSTVFTKGFLLGIVMTPVILFVVAGAMILMKNQKGPQIAGTIAVIDRSGLLRDGIDKQFSPEEVQAEIAKDADKVKAIAAEQAERVGLPEDQLKQVDAIGDAVKQAAAMGPALTIEHLASDANAEDAKKPLEVARIARKSEQSSTQAVPRIGLVIVPEASIKGDGNGAYPGFEAFFADRVDFEIQQRVKRRVSDVIVEARLAEDTRLLKAGISPAEVRTLVGTPKAEIKTVTKEGEKKSLGELTMLIPVAFMILLMISVITSGQYLLTSTVEEKSNRVMEVLLSAASPMQLMTGKILGYMGVGLLILVLYSGLGLAGLAYATTQNIIQPMQLVYLFVFFIIAYFLMASTMAAVGAAVNDMREAQTLMSPLMFVFMLPWLTWFFIQRAPNSALATTLSFIPLTNPFVMIIRLSGSEPVPTWQIPVSILVGILSVIAAAWAAGKIFRVGALMYGKPPDFKTLWRWIKMA
jgi:ABC-2 type transport system permease protein